MYLDMSVRQHIFHKPRVPPFLWVKGKRKLESSLDQLRFAEWENCHFFKADGTVIMGSTLEKLLEYNEHADTPNK